MRSYNKTVTRSERWASAAGVCWLATALYFPLTVIAAAAWPSGYDVRADFISDLGVTRCGVFTDSLGSSGRMICSPHHAMWNAGMIAVGLLTALGSLAWVAARHGRLQRFGCALLGVSGLAVAGCGLVPWDINGGAHAAFALDQWTLQLVGMIAIAVANRDRIPAISAFTAVAMGISVFGVIGLVSTSHWGLGPGLTERLGFDSLGLWIIAVGALLLRPPVTAFKRFLQYDGTAAITEIISRPGGG